MDIRYYLKTIKIGKLEMTVKYINTKKDIQILTKSTIVGFLPQT